MKKVLLAVVAICMAATMSAQTLLNEGFNGSSVPSGWTMFNDSNTPYYTDFQSSAWAMMASMGNPAPCIATTSYFTPAATADRWLITPAITIPATGYVLSFEASSANASYLESMQVKVCTTTPTARTDFNATPIFSNTALPVGFTEYTVDLSAYAGQTIYIAFIDNANDMLAMFLDNIKVQVPPTEEMQLTSVSFPRYAGINTNVSVSGVIKNKGTQALTSFDLQYVVNGTDTVSETLTGLNVAYNASYTFTATTPINLPTEGTCNVQVIVSNPNGVADDASDNVLSGSFVFYDATNAVTRTSLIEQFTGNQCGYCPGGHDRIAAAVEGRTDYIWMVHHAGYNTDALSNASSSALTFFYNDNSTYAPAVMFDRSYLSAEDPGPVMSVPATAGITSYLDEATSAPCFLTLALNNVNFNESSRAVTGTVAGHFTSNIYSANTRLAVYVVEDSIVLTQADYTNGTQPLYIHMHTARTTITNQWGDAITPDANGDFTYNISYTLPAMTTITGGHHVNKAWHTRLVALVYNYDATNANNCAVMNAATCPKFTATSVGIDEVASNVELNVYPNPATNFVVLNANNNINTVTVVNTLGQTIYTNNAVNAESFQLNTQNYASGMYIVTIKTDNGISTKRFSVVK